MTIAKLIEELQGWAQEMGSETEVRFLHDSGDYWRTVLAKEVETVEPGYVKHSEYHRCDQLVDDDEADDEDHQWVLTLRS